MQGRKIIGIQVTTTMSNHALSPSLLQRFIPLEKNMDNVRSIGMNSYPPSTK